MNTIINGKNKLTYINHYHKGSDALKKRFPRPISNNEKWKDQLLFEKNFNYLQKMSNYTKYKKPIHCKLCNQKNITKGVYNFKNLAWDDGLNHYITKHNVKVHTKFKKYVNNMKDISLFKFKSYGRKKIKLTRNQLNIMDALLFSGGDKTVYEKKNNFYYSEHFGLLDFNKDGLESYLIDANTERVDEGDDTILMPTTNRKDLKDFEYIFHTHPPENNKPGGRIFDGILYEFPSMADIFHFIHYHNIGNVNGSIVATCEGLYLIRSLKENSKKIDMSDKVEDLLNKEFSDIQEEAIEKYGTTFSNDVFYSKIAQNTSYIKRINKIMLKDSLVIDYYPRIKNKKNKWVFPEITLSVDVVELN
jgi:hypothetical protein